MGVPAADWWLNFPDAVARLRLTAVREVPGAFKKLIENPVMMVL
jgi:hypothetical protein